jgi:hypothetical protein
LPGLHRKAQQWRIWFQLSKLVNPANANSNGSRTGSERHESSGPYISLILVMLARRTKTMRALSSDP